MQSLIDKLFDFNDPRVTEARFREEIERSLDSAKRLELLTQIARAQGLQRRFDDAHATLHNVEQALARCVTDTRFAASRVRLLLERGRVFNSAGQRQAALPLFEQAFAAAQRLNDDHLAVDAAHMVAIVHGADQRCDEALRWNRMALDIAERTAQPRARQWRAGLHNNIGWTLHDRRDFSEALAHFERALACRSELGKPDDMRTARWCIGRCLRSLGRLDEALDMQRALHDEHQRAAGDADGYVHEELAECLLALGRISESRAHFTRAHKVLAADPWLAEREPERLARLHRLSHDGP